MNTSVSNRVAAIQMVSTHDIDANLNEARKLLAKASSEGALIAVLPENFAVLATDQMVDCGQVEVSAQPVIRTFLAEQAKKLGMWIVGGSLPLADRPDGSSIEERVRSSCLVFDDQGREVARYDKIHLFDATIDDAHGQYRESDTFEPGEQLVTLDTPVGKLGLAVCYDLRFPELFRALREKGAEWVCLPSAFTWQTGNAHWHVLTRARAIENQVWIVAPGQGGQNSERRRTYGHSLICDPWGKVVKELAEGAGVLTAELDVEQLSQLRKRMPVWDHRRL
ncbi:carbon-nitrogen hydrolase family protein [Marinobacter sediminum]|uniref:carbon-nitrogen hydrolase family protein n=1 Tax=Marinobacter sediminum TaxID=256323 RepID=UPI00202E5FC0|nr:carbon-nitrogen hydrolase family protein [Marinobacter sediminum]MCM0612696.1 carbon-nitrogen hydrolase family protein [Marinobacter sediminum]